MGASTSRPSDERELHLHYGEQYGEQHPKCNRTIFDAGFLQRHRQSGGSVAQGAQFDTATLGTHTFTATVVDSATNTVSQPVTYTVVGAADVAILKLAAPRVRQWQQANVRHRGGRFWNRKTLLT